MRNDMELFAEKFEETYGHAPQAGPLEQTLRQGSTPW